MNRAIWLMLMITNNGRLLRFIRNNNRSYSPFPGPFMLRPLGVVVYPTIHKISQYRYCSELYLVEKGDESLNLLNYVVLFTPKNHWGLYEMRFLHSLVVGGFFLFKYKRITTYEIRKLV